MTAVLRNLSTSPSCGHLSTSHTLIGWPKDKQHPIHGMKRWRVSLEVVYRFPACKASSWSLIGWPPLQERKLLWFLIPYVFHLRLMPPWRSDREERKVSRLRASPGWEHKESRNRGCLSVSFYCQVVVANDRHLKDKNLHWTPHSPWPLCPLHHSEAWGRVSRMTGRKAYSCF